MSSRQEILDRIEKHIATFKVGDWVDTILDGEEIEGEIIHLGKNQFAKMKTDHGEFTINLTITQHADRPIKIQVQPGLPEKPIERVFLFHRSKDVLILRVETDSTPGMCGSHKVHTMNGGTIIVDHLPFPSTVPSFIGNRGYFDIVWINPELEDNYLDEVMGKLLWESPDFNPPTLWAQQKEWLVILYRDDQCKYKIAEWPSHYLFCPKKEDKTVVLNGITYQIIWK